MNVIEIEVGEERSKIAQTKQNAGAVQCTGLRAGRFALNAGNVSM